MNALIIVVLLAQETQPFAWAPQHWHIADSLSTVAVGANVAGATVEAWRASDRKHALGCLALRNFIVYGATTTIKHSVQRWRPDRSDQFSFPSGHTAFAAVNQWRFAVSVPITVGAGYGRAAANRHYWTDIAAGAGIGFLSRKVCTP